jgi:hypothetical protein
LKDDHADAVQKAKDEIKRRKDMQKELISSHEKEKNDMIEEHDTALEKQRKKREEQREKHKREKDFLKEQKERERTMLMENFSMHLFGKIGDEPLKKRCTWGWREQTIHAGHAKRINDLESQMGLQKLEEQKIHMKTRGDALVKYFAERVSPAVHDKAMVKEGFGAWKEASSHAQYEVEKIELDGLRKEE